MHKTMAATALSFLLAIGGGVALANTTSGNQGSSSAGTTSSDTTGSQASEHQGTRANRQATPANNQAPVGFAEEEVSSGPFTVQSVDKKNRNLVLHAPDGTQSTVNIPTGTPGFDSLNKGDEIQLDYFAAAAWGPANQQANRASQNGSMQRSSSNQGNGAANNHIGRVSNIRKVNGKTNMGSSNR
jgi:hypothetical protein